MDQSFLLRLKRARSFIAVLTLLGLGAALAFALTRPTLYRTSLSLSINRVHRQATSDYQFDGYYAIQAADLFAQTAVSWMSTPSILLEIYRGAGLEPEMESLDTLKTRFRTRKFSSQNIVVEFTEANREDSAKVADSLLKVLQDQTAGLNRTGEGEALFEIVGSAPVIVAVEPNPVLLGILGAVTGFLIAIVLLAIQYALFVPAPEKK